MPKSELYDESKCDGEHPCLFGCVCHEDQCVLPSIARDELVAESSYLIGETVSEIENLEKKIFFSSAHFL